MTNLMRARLDSVSRHLPLQELGFGKCKLCVQAPVTAGIKDVKALSGKRIVTSFPSVCKTFFDQYDTPGNPTSETHTETGWARQLFLCSTTQFIAGRRGVLVLAWLPWFVSFRRLIT